MTKYLYSYIIILFLGISPFLSYAQVSNHNTPEGILDFSGITSQGLVLPQIALTDRVTQSPVVNPESATLTEGTIVYNTATAGTAPNDVAPGFYFWRDAEWYRLEDYEESGSARWTDANDTNNVNDASSENNIIETLVWNDDPTLYEQPTGKDDDAVVKEDGRYEIRANLFLRNVDFKKCNISFRIRVTKGGTTHSFPSAARTVYFAGGSDDEYRSVVFREVLDLEAEDDVSVFSMNIGGDSGGSAKVQINNSIGIRSNFYIRKLD